METPNIDRAHIVGHSYDGTIALQLAIDAPNKIHTRSLSIFTVILTWEQS